MRYVPGEGPVDVHSLTSGLVNESCRVGRAGRLYALRVAAGSQDLGLDREWECRVLAVAAAAGLAPNIVYCDPAQGVLVADWVMGSAWTLTEIQQPDRIDAMTQLLCQVHALPIPQPARAISAAAWIAHYDHALDQILALGDSDVTPRSAGQRTAERPSARLRDAAAVGLDRLTAFRAPPSVLCHGDLHRLNVLIGPRMVLLDWEYAHVSDPFWDLAGWIANNDLTGSVATHLLASYLGRPAAPEESARLRLLMWLYDYVCLQWSGLYLCRRPGSARDGTRDGVSGRAIVLATRLSNEPAP